MAIKNLFWIDMEMTGLDPNRHKILEVALIVTDIELNIIETYEDVIFQDDGALKEMDQWCKTTHTSSGLTAKVPDGIHENESEQKLISIIRKYCTEKERAVIAGNSIHQDRKFIDKYMPKFAQMLHYRMLDTSSFKIMFENKYKKKFEKKIKHRALDDIVESINELKFYLGFISIKS